MSAGFESYLKDRAQRVDLALDRFLPADTVAPETIHKAMRYSLFAGGKRLRPVLALAAAEACGGTIDNALPAATARSVFPKPEPPPEPIPNPEPEPTPPEPDPVADVDGLVG